LKYNGLLIAILLLATGLRSYQLDTRSLWFDEAFSWRITEFPMREVTQRVAADHQPPLYFWMLKAWVVAFGDSVIALRSLSVLLGVATVAGMYWFILESHQRDGDRAIALAAYVAAAVAVSTVQIRWSTEVRMYTLGAALTAFSSAALFRALGARAASGFWWPAYAALAAALSMTHYYGLFTIAAQVAFACGVLLYENSLRISACLQDVRTWFAASSMTLIAAAWSWWYPTFMLQRAQVQASFWLPPVTVTDFGFALYQLLVTPENGSFNAWAVGAVALACGIALVALLVRPTAASIFIFCAAVIPMVLSVVVSLLDTRVFHPRYLVFAQLFLLAAFVKLLWRIPSRPARHTATIAAIAALIMAHVHYWREMEFSECPGAKGAVEYVERQRVDDEPVIVCHSFYYFPLVYYSRASNWHCYNQGRPVVRYGGSAVVLPDDLISESELSAIATRRVWVIEQEGGGWGPRTVPVPSSWKVDREPTSFREPYWFQGTIVVRCYQPETRGLN
jgi:mannosyltransferase